MTEKIAVLAPMRGQVRTATTVKPGLAKAASAVRGEIACGFVQQPTMSIRECPSVEEGCIAEAFCAFVARLLRVTFWRRGCLRRAFRGASAALRRGRDLSVLFATWPFMRVIKDTKVPSFRVFQANCERGANGLREPLQFFSSSASCFRPLALNRSRSSAAICSRRCPIPR